MPGEASIRMRLSQSGGRQLPAAVDVAGREEQIPGRNILRKILPAAGQLNDTISTFVNIGPGLAPDADVGSSAFDSLWLVAREQAAALVKIISGFYRATDGNGVPYPVETVYLANLPLAQDAYCKVLHSCANELLRCEQDTTEWRAIPEWLPRSLGNALRQLQAAADDPTCAEAVEHGCRLGVQRDGRGYCHAMLDGKSFEVSEVAADFIDALIKANGEFVSGSEIGFKTEHFGKLPGSIQELICRERARGSRLLPTAWRS